MMGLLVFKERLRIFYAKNSQIVIPILKFIVAFTAFYLIGKSTTTIRKISVITATSREMEKSWAMRKPPARNAVTPYGTAAPTSPITTATRGELSFSTNPVFFPIR